MKEKFGQPLVLPRFRGRIEPRFNKPDFIRAVADCQALLDDPKAEILLDSRNRVGAVALPLDRENTVDVVIKEFRTRGVNRLKSLFLRGKASRSWRGSMTLVERGIETPPPVAFLENRKGLVLDQSFFLTERVREVREIRSLFRELEPLELDGLLVSLSRYLRHGHDRGVLHRDLSDGNILVQENKPGGYRYYLIDTNRIRFKRRMGLLRRIRNLIRLGVPREKQRFFLEQYFGKNKIKGFFWFWYRMNKGAYANYIGLKKKLRLRQLVRKFKIQ